MSSEDFEKEFNISAKNIYRKWLMEAIEKNEYESFKDCVLNLGIEWHVIRTVKKVKREDFCKKIKVNIKIDNCTMIFIIESFFALKSILMSPHKL